MSRSPSSVVPRRVVALAARQHGVIAREQLRACGASADQVARWIAHGWLTRIHVTVYGVGRVAPDATGRFHAAVLAGGPHAALSHLSAADHLGLRPSRRTVVDVTVRRGGEHRRTGIRFHRPRVFGTQDVVVVDGIACTTVARTLVDLAGTLRVPDQLEKAVERAEHLRMLDVQAISEVLDRIDRPRGVRRLRLCLGPERLGASMSRSTLERRFLRLCREAGLARPVVNGAFQHAPGQWYEIDFLWPSIGLAIETDGWATHGNPVAARRDRRRDRDLRAAGLRVERFMWDDVVLEPWAVVAFLRAAGVPSAASRDDG